MDATNSSFTFSGHETDLKNGEITFIYELQNDKQKYLFKERIIVSSKIEEHSASSLRPFLDTLLLALGISYWKTFCPKNIIIKPFSLNKEQANFWDVVYTKGLGEFYYRNNIDFRQLVHFPYHDTATMSPPVHKVYADRSLVFLGGGKDSIVTARALEEHHKKFALFALNPVPLQDKIVAKLGAEYVRVKRILDPQLFDLNRQGEVYNGHVPISSIYASVGLFMAALYDYRYIIASNEVSANYGNVKYLGQIINHQWSKSIEFERAFQLYVHRFVTSDIQYFSILRPIHEVVIVKLFTKYSEFFPIFSSCNNNFKLSGEVQDTLWCGKCPKCSFVFLLLTAFLPKAQVTGIFGKNLFADGSLLAVYRELLGFGGFKPFECVGTPEESIWAFSQMIARGEYAHDVVVKVLSAEVEKHVNRLSAITKTVLGKSTGNAIPKEFVNVISPL